MWYTVDRFVHMELCYTETLLSRTVLCYGHQTVRHFTGGAYSRAVDKIGRN
jgi:hypothetical protein